MAVSPQNYVTREEVENSYEFKLIKRIIKKEFPFIREVLLPPDDQLNKYSLIFLDMVIDPFMLQREKGWEINRFVKSYYGVLSNFNKGPYRYVSNFLSTIYDIDRPTAQTVVQPIERTMEAVASSPAIPKDLKLGKDRKFVTGTWLIPHDIPLPDDAVFTR